MSDPFREGGRPESLRDHWMSLPRRLKALVPDANFSYYEATNSLHCGEGEGGSKFADPEVRNIFDVLRMHQNLASNIVHRVDDRADLIAAGAPKDAFLPSTKASDAPEGLPEALYFKVENVEGRLGVIKLSELRPDTRLLVRREKGKSDPNDRKTYSPVSFTAIQGTVEEMPKTNFATVIVGREPGGSDELWTVHPGAPVRPAMGEYSFTQGLLGPDELAQGEKQPVRVMTVEEVKKLADLNDNDYVKIIPGDFEEMTKKYNIVSELNQDIAFTPERLLELSSLESEVHADFSPLIEEINRQLNTHLAPRPDGFHMTIIGPAENSVLKTLSPEKIAELEQLNKELQGGKGIQIRGIGYLDGATMNVREADKTKRAAFIALEAPKMNAFRASLGLPSKDLHITLGFENGDLHMQIVGTKEKGKPILGPVEKKANAQFDDLMPLIEASGLKFGSLSGARKQEKQDDKPVVKEEKFVVHYDIAKLETQLSAISVLHDADREQIVAAARQGSEALVPILKTLGGRLRADMRLVRDALLNSELKS